MRSRTLSHLGRSFRRDPLPLPELPQEQRQVILLVGLEGMRYEEVAAILGVPVGTVRSRLSRGRDALRRLMDIPERGAGATHRRAGLAA